MNYFYKLKPVTKDLIWGGNQLKREYHKESTNSNIAESWELSAYPNSESIIDSGEEKMLLSEFYKKYPEYFGKFLNKYEDFPLLIKLINAAKPLSVQVHPDDEYAKKHEGQMGKNEFWLILDADDDSYIYYGLKDKLTKEELRNFIENKSLEIHLNKVKVKPGQGFYIPSGTIHAIGPNITLLEVQQNSDVTYRIYDYDRKDQNGNKRELHIDEAIKVSNLEPIELFPSEDLNSFDSKYFRIRKFDVRDGEEKVPLSRNSFSYVICSEGELTLSVQAQSVVLNKGNSVLIPATSKELQITGNGTCIVVDINHN